MKKLALAVSFLLFSLFGILPPLSAQNQLSIVNPQWGLWDWGYPGTIEEAVFTLKPQGLYVEVGLYLTFSWPENPYDINDSLEIVFDFDLPEGAIVNDSWLWVGDEVVKADIWEIWTALQTYSDIVVVVQQDPSVLYKKPEGGYQLRVYPLVTQESRKVKINYLIPAFWTEEEVLASLPIELLSTSKNPVNNFRTLVYADPAWENYRFKELPGLSFQAINDPEYGVCLEAVIPPADWTTSLHLAMDTPPLSNGLFVGRHTGGGNNIYELAFFPQSLPPVEKTTRLMVAVDYKTGKSDLSFSEVLEILKTELKEQLEDDDFFNLTIGNSQTIYTASQNWIPAEDASIDFVFDNFTPSTAGSQKPLINLLQTAGNRIVNNGLEGEMLLVSNTDEYNDPWYANPAMETFMNAFQGSFPVHVCDFQSKNFAEYWENWWENQPSHYGNEIFNSSLATLTDGTYLSLRGSNWDFPAMLDFQLSSYIEGVQMVFDLDADLETGFCYQPYMINYLGQSEYAHLPILQIGRYEGGFPMTVEFFALADGQIVSETITVQESQVVELDTLAQEAWVGNHFQAWDSDNNDPNVISQIVNMSIQERVLSKYTAFIAIDPNLVIEPCYICPFGNQGGAIVEVKEKPEDNARLHAFPNPFTQEVTIELKGLSAGQVRIYNQMGSLVRILEPEPSLLWDGRNSNGEMLPAGLYVVAVIDEDGRAFNMKLIKL
ncbi:MAG: T9SS type A sorting domain-containing protein [Lewinellaceae bacterium]|nr:T9SS type A sorting domain-containing protein [Lewinellaceae bacterium]